MTSCEFCGGDYKNVPAHKRFCKMNPDGLYNKKVLQSSGDVTVKDNLIIRVSPDTSKSSSAGAISEKMPNPPVIAGTPDTPKPNKEDNILKIVHTLILTNIIALIVDAALLYYIYIKV